MACVSVVVPVYNVSKYLKQCLDSLINQTLSDIEIICVNDGSTDDSLSILNKYADADIRVKVISKSNTGYGNSVNVGISAANGEYIGIVEPDDYVSEDMYAILYDMAVKNALDCVKADYTSFVSSENLEYSYEWHMFNAEKQAYYGKIINPADYPMLLWMDNYYWRGIYNRAFFMNNNIRLHETPGAAYQDVGVKYQILTQAHRVMYLNSAFYHYRRDNTGASSFNPKGISIMYKEFEFIQDYMNNNISFCNIFMKGFYYDLYSQFNGQIEKLFSANKFTEVKEYFDGFGSLIKDGFDKGLFDFDGENLWISSDVNLLITNPEAFFYYRKAGTAFRKMCLQRFLNKCRADKIVLVSAGRLTKRYFHLLAGNGIEIQAVCDNKSTGSIYGHDIMTVEQAVNTYKDALFIVTSSKYGLELMRQLTDMGVDETRCYNPILPLDDYFALTFKI